MLFSFAIENEGFANLAGKRIGPWQLCQSKIEGSTVATNEKPPVEQRQFRREFIKKIQIANYKR